MLFRCSHIQFLFLPILIAAPFAFAETPNEEMLKALKPLSPFVGSWKGDGNSIVHSGWKETTEVTWGFRKADGRVSLNFYFEGNPLLDAALLTYDPETKDFRFIAS